MPPDQDPSLDLSNASLDIDHTSIIRALTRSCTPLDNADSLKLRDYLRKTYMANKRCEFEFLVKQKTFDSSLATKIFRNGIGLYMIACMNKEKKEKVVPLYNVLEHETSAPHGASEIEFDFTGH